MHYRLLEDPVEERAAAPWWGRTATVGAADAHAPDVERAVALAKMAEEASVTSRAFEDSLKSLCPLVTHENAAIVSRAVLESAPGLPKQCVKALDLENEVTAEVAANAICVLARAADSQVTLLATPQLVHKLQISVSTCTSDSFKEMALNALCNLTLNPRNKVAMFKIPGLLDTLIRVAKSNATSGSKAAALRVISSLAIALENKTPMCNNADIVQVISMAALSDSTDDIKGAALGAIGNLSAAVTNFDHVLNVSRLGDMLVREVSTGSTDNIRQAALLVINNVATVMENRRPLIEVPGLVDALVRAAAEGAPDQYKKVALNAIRSLTVTTADNVHKLYDTPGLVDALVSVVLRIGVDGNDTFIEEAAISALCNISAFMNDENKNVKLFNIPHLTEALVRAAGFGATNAIREYALAAIGNLATALDNKVPLCTTPGVLRVLVDSMRTGAMDGIVESALTVVCNLAAAPDNTAMLCATPGLVEILMDLSSHARVRSHRAAAGAALFNLRRFALRLAPPTPVEVRAPVKTKAPATKEEVRAWLKTKNLDVFDILDAKGFAETRFSKLQVLPVSELVALFKISEAQAFDLWDALRRESW